MSNLLKHRWYELRHNPIFWLTFIICCIFTIVLIEPDYLKNTPMVPGITKNIQGLFMAAAADAIIPLAIISGAFTAMLIGQPFSARTVGHEISAGHSRAEIFTSLCAVGFIVPNLAALASILIGCFRWAGALPMPPAETAVPYFLRTLALLLLLNFSLFSPCLIIAVLFRDTAKTMSISAIFLLAVCWTMAALLATSANVPGTDYTNSPSLALMLHPAYLMRFVLRPALTLQQGAWAAAVAVGWSALSSGIAYCIFRRCELK